MFVWVPPPPLPGWRTSTTMQYHSLDESKHKNKRGRGDILRVKDQGLSQDVSKGGGGGHTVSNIIAMTFSPRNLVGCLLKKRLTKGGGGHGHPRTPLATPLKTVVELKRGVAWQC